MVFSGVAIVDDAPFVAPENKRSNGTYSGGPSLILSTVSPSRAPDFGSRPSNMAPFVQVPLSQLQPSESNCLPELVGIVDPEKHDETSFDGSTSADESWAGLTGPSADVAWALPPMPYVAGTSGGPPTAALPTVSGAAAKGVVEDLAGAFAAKSGVAGPWSTPPSLSRPTLMQIETHLTENLSKPDLIRRPRKPSVGPSSVAALLAASNAISATMRSATNSKWKELFDQLPCDEKRLTRSRFSGLVIAPTCKPSVHDGCASFDAPRPDGCMGHGA
eukprot:TRINITY_DN67461_c0_g1_i1.p1 TRINITY_DN67461_c0_g1~~TRINITY_DN67461_c0_g1_i1.p1  ORF type:complete len:275 (-),score=28.65 TRINITY_DN67461_c0_g1_i1:240-1064(-)